MSRRDGIALGAVAVIVLVAWAAQSLLSCDMADGGLLEAVTDLIADCPAG